MPEWMSILFVYNQLLTFLMVKILQIISNTVTVGLEVIGYSVFEGAKKGVRTDVGGDTREYMFILKC